MEALLSLIRLRKNPCGSIQALDVKRGDRVIFDQYAGTEVKIDDREYLIMKEKDILGILEE